MKKPYAVEWKCEGKGVPIATTCGYFGWDWKVWKRYETQERAEQAVEAQRKKNNPWLEFRLKKP